MDLEEIIKALDGKEVGSDVITAIKGLDQTGEVERLTQAVTDAEGKAAGILADKKRYKDERDAHKSALDKIETDKLPAEAQHAKAMEELQAKLDQSEADRQADAAQTAKTAREATIGDLTGSIQWGKNMPRESAKLLVKNAIDGIDDPSPTNPLVVEALKTLTDAHKPFIDASVPSGSGGSEKSGGGGAGRDEPTIAGAVESAWQ